MSTLIFEHEISLKQIGTSLAFFIADLNKDISFRNLWTSLPLNIEKVCYLDIEKAAKKFTMYSSI